MYQGEVLSCSKINGADGDDGFFSLLLPLFSNVLGHCSQAGCCSVQPAHVSHEGRADDACQEVFMEADVRVSRKTQGGARCKITLIVPLPVTGLTESQQQL